MWRFKSKLQSRISRNSCSSNMALRRWRNYLYLLNSPVLLPTTKSKSNVAVLGGSFINTRRHLASKADIETSNESLQTDVILEPENILTEEEILKKRNKSRLTEYHQRMLVDEVPHPEPKHWIHHTVRYKRRTYGHFGEQSGINPGLMWPTHEEIAEKLEYEKIAYPFTFQEMVDKKKEEKRLAKEDHEKRAKEIYQKMALVEKMIQDIHNKKLAKEKEVAAAKAKREALMEEVRRHFGYTIDPRDARFQELLEKKEKAQRKAQKDAKKAERQRQMMERLTQGLTTEIKIEPVKANAGPAEEEKIEKPKKKKAPAVVEDDDNDDETDEKSKKKKW